MSRRSNRSLQRINRRRKYLERREPAIMRFNDRPWREVRVGFGQHILHTRQVFAEARLLPQIVFCYPPRCRAVCAEVVEPASLFLLGDVKKEFHDHRPFIRQLTFKRAYVLESLTK